MMLQRCRRQLAELRMSSVEVCALMRQMSRDLVDNGSSPSASAIERIRKFRSDFEDVQATIVRPMETGTPQQDLPLSGLQDELEAQSMIQATLARLDCFTLIRHVEYSEFAPLQRCLAEGTKLREHLLTAPTNEARVSAEGFLAPHSPLNAIVTLIVDERQLADERWSMLLDSVSAAYGREVSTAIARGKLILTSGARA